jgi:transcriptional regulator with XRE-family HTH domain
MLEKKIISARLKAFRRAINVKQKNLADEIGMSIANLVRIETGKLFPSMELLIHLYNEYNLNLNWIISGIGEMFRANKTNQIEELIGTKEVDEDLSNIIKYLKYKPIQRELATALELALMQPIMKQYFANLSVIEGVKKAE